mmetsp:Transcript_6464/g.10832  ORF Transcript_6464/g.10832 Transcript_6464/m.10832 type:complete len:214 (+) Transcript_6464:254-895(+)
MVHNIGHCSICLCCCGCGVLYTKYLIIISASPPSAPSCRLLFASLLVNYNHMNSLTRWGLHGSRLALSFATCCLSGARTRRAVSGLVPRLGLLANPLHVGCAAVQDGVDFALCPRALESKCGARFEHARRRHHGTRFSSCAPRLFLRISFSAEAAAAPFRGGAAEGRKLGSDFSPLVDIRGFLFLVPGNGLRHIFRGKHLQFFFEEGRRRDRY